MFISYLKTAYSILRRNISYTVLNVAGLTLSIAACLIIFLIVRNELGYDQFYKKADRTYRVTLHELDYNPSVSLAVAPALRNDFPELEQVAQYWYQETGLVKTGNTRFNEKGFAFADAAFLQIFDQTWLAGDPRTALSDPDEVVLTAGIATKYFGNKDPIGQIIQLNNENNLKVTGVVKDPPANSSQPFAFLVSYETIRKDMLASAHFYNISGASTYILLPEKYNASQLQSRMKSFIAQNWGADIAADANLLLQPLKEVHFDQRYQVNPAAPTANKATYHGLLMVALFIIITACINFINMATVQAIRRAKEVGVRKVLGAHRLQLIWQFLSETALLVLLAVVLGIFTAALFLPAVAAWIDVQVTAAALLETPVLLAIAGITVTVILLSGGYPAFVQSAFQPVTALKSNTGLRIKGLGLRKVLVATQFGISQLLIAGTLIVGYQMDFLKNQDLGFNKKAIISFPVPDDSKREILEAQLLANPGVRQFSFASGPPVGGSGYSAFTCPEEGLIKDDVTERKAVDEKYLDLFSIRLLAGEKPHKRLAGDTLHKVLINETMLHKLHQQVPEKAIGKTFYINGDAVMIAGVVQNFQSESRYKKNRPCVLEYRPDRFRTACVQIAPKDMTGTLARIDKSWSALFTNDQFQYDFLDDRIARLYQQEQKLYTAFKLFSALAIVIGCLGLYGLVAFAAVQRQREVGIRKVLGASLFQITGLFAKEFIVLILLAFCVAGPLAWWVMQHWLDNFAYQTHIGGGTFLTAISISVVIAGITIASQAIKAGLVNPVKSLR
ncbi:MAG: ABC transporter permease [Chitinophaga sp.]|uniref:ABC transporter permease n=1 Tax=Chitinophaga sp. TaxID=1869181 RepID=UPI001B1A3643|nr:ABC transporter permease [Chitinophaga sp.]MBO9731258.1 ABC transporter permease [Chitinophaga sp.]